MITQMWLHILCTLKWEDQLEVSEGRWKIDGKFEYVELKMTTHCILWAWIGTQISKQLQSGSEKISLELILPHPTPSPHLRMRVQQLCGKILVRHKHI